MIQYEYEECPRCFRLIVCRAVWTVWTLWPGSLWVTPGQNQWRLFRPALTSLALALPSRAGLQNTLTSLTLTNKKRGGGGKKCITVSHISWSSYAANNWTEAGKLWRKNMQQVIIGHVRVPIDSELDSGEEEDTGSLLG